MAILGAVVQQIGIVAAVGGYALYAGTVLIRLFAIFLWRKVVVGTLVAGFYARAIGTLGVMTLVTGGVIKGTIAWPLLILVFVVGAPALALLLVRPVRADDPFGLSWRKAPPRR